MKINDEKLIPHNIKEIEITRKEIKKFFDNKASFSPDVFLDLSVNRLKTCRELADDFNQKLEKMGLERGSILLKYTTSENISDELNAVTTVDSARLIHDLGLPQYRATYAQEFIDRIEIGYDHSFAKNHNCIVMLKSKTFIVEKIGNMILNRPLYILPPNPKYAILAFIHDNGQEGK
jgi:hypothetical protein